MLIEKRCPECGGDGFIRIYSDSSVGGAGQTKDCGLCEGTGEIYVNAKEKSALLSGSSQSSQADQETLDD